MNSQQNPAPEFNQALSDEETIDLRHYWRVLMRFKKGIIGLGLLSATVAALVVIGMVNIYESTADLLIEPNNNNVVSIEELYGIDSQSREYFSTQFELLKNRNLAERVIRELDLLNNLEFVPAEEEASFIDSIKGSIRSLLKSDEATGPVPDPELALMTRVLGTFNKRLTIAPVRGTDLVQITFESEDPKLAAAVANSLANAYIESQLEQRLDASQKANLWLSDRLQGLKDTLDSSEQTLQTFLETESLVDVQGVTTLNIQELDELTSQSVEARRTRAALESIYQQIQQLDDPSAEELMTFPAILNHSAVQDVKENADDVARNIAELSKRYGRNHPRMIALAAQQETVDANLIRQVRRVMASIGNDYRSAIEREETTLSRLAQSKTELQEINRKSFELQQLQREVATSSQLYDLFFTRIRETAETTDFQSANAILVDPAVPAISPSKPRRSLIVMIALVAGFMFGVLLAFLRDMLDNTVKGHTDIEERLHATTLGLVPMVKRDKSEVANTDLAYLGFMDDKHSTFSESLRTIRTSITLSSLDNPYKVIEVTSSIPNEGKTTLSINLAAALGQMHSTLLIDTDMRRPSLAKSIGLPPNSPGLSNYIAGTAELKDCVYRYKEAGIAVMPAGQISPNPLELISSKKFRDLLDELKGIYGHIILDTPPTQAVSDSLVLASFSDATIYVVKADATSINVIKHGLSRLKYANANVLGVVLNQVDANKQSGYNYGGYYDSYGYSGYGYGGKPKEA